MARKPSAKSLMTAQLTAERAADAPAPSRLPAPALPNFLALQHHEIVPDPLNARKTFDPDGIAQLADTMFTHGLQQPPVVSAWNTPATKEIEATGGLAYQLVAGERRWRAWRLLIDQGRWAPDHVEMCRLETADERTRMEAALIENLQRVDLNHMEAGEAFEELGSRYHISNKDIAAQIGRTPEYVQQHRRLTKLDPKQQARLRDGSMTMEEARQALSRPRVADMTKEQILLLAEVFHKLGAQPAKDAGYYSWGRTEIAHTATQDGRLEDFNNRQVLALIPRDHSSQRAYVAISYHGHVFARGEQGDFKPLLTAGSKADALLAEFQRKCRGKDEPERLAAASRTYAIDWLNGPFDLHPEAAEALEQRAIEKAEHAKAAKAEKARLAEQEAKEAVELAKLDAELAAMGIEDLALRFGAAFARAGAQGPFRPGRYSSTGVEAPDNRSVAFLQVYGGSTKLMTHVFATLLTRITPTLSPDELAAIADEDGDLDEDAELDAEYDALSAADAESEDAE